MEIKETLTEYGLTPERYESMLKDISDKTNKNSELEWSEILDKYGINMHYDTLRKAAQPPLFGSTFISEYYKEKNAENVSDDSYLRELELAKSELRKERMKLQTANMERSRIDRSEARQEMYYEYVGSMVEALPVPEFVPFTKEENPVQYLLNIADIHYGATFKSENNEYSPTIAQERFEYLTGYAIDFIKKHNVKILNIATLGDDIQGLIHLTDLKINDSSIVKATVDISRLIACFLTELSKYAQINYYHVCSANHTQLRVLGAKASELASEDIEYVIGNYIKDLCSANDRIKVSLSEEGKGYILTEFFGEKALLMHGHQVKNISNAVNDFGSLLNEDITYLIIGHQHGGKEFISNEGICCDKEVIICPSFVGSDPYSDSIMRGSKAAAKIIGFEQYYGHTETYKIQLN